jgi:ribosomal protein L11 methyltransferase
MKKIEKLFIYELQGEIEAPRGSLGEDFLGCWREAGYSYLFFSSPHEKRIADLVENNPGYQFVCQTILDYDQWEPADFRRPFDVLPLRFVPAWMNLESRDEMQIRIDPGVVFGAGSHDTTRTCLEFLVSLMQREAIRNVADLGTGTGILALAAARLGADTVTAVDNNNLAVETAQRNVELNHLQKKVSCVQADAAEFMEEESDLVIANLIFSELKRLFLPDRDCKSRWYIVSGLKGSEAKAFSRHIEATCLRVVRSESRDIWHTMLMKREPSPCLGD